MRLIPRLGSRQIGERTQRQSATKLRLQALEDRALPSFGFGSAFGVGGTGADYGNAVVRDAAGGLYVSGFYNGTVDFDPNHTGSASILTATDPTNGDGFVAKYAADGTFQWATDLGSGYALELAVQGSNVYVPYLSSGGFVSRLDASTGAITWTTAITTNTDGAADAVAVGPTGNVYVAGRTHNGSGQAIVDRLDPTAGSILWTQVSSGGSAGAWRLAVDGSGNLFATGFDSGTTTFGSTTLTTAGQFIWKLNANGGSVWAGNLTSTGGVDIWGVAADANGNAYLAGSWYAGTNNFNPGSGKAVNLTNHGSSDVFVEKLASGSNGVMQLAWAKDIGGSGGDTGNAVAVDGSGNVYTTGGFNGSVNFNPNSGTKYNLSGGGVFVSKLDANGNFVAAASMAATADGNGAGAARSIALDGTGNVYTTGFFNGTADFDPTVGTYNLTANGSSDIFVSKLTNL